MTESLSTPVSHSNLRGFKLLPPLIIVLKVSFHLSLRFVLPVPVKTEVSYKILNQDEKDPEQNKIEFLL